ncbi:MAG: tRNA threonylcarbamoyladenosine biosynthesis protein TsaB [Adlercreutzia equolifaciens]
MASVEVEARRASNTQLLPRIDELCAQAGVGRGEIACVAVGRGPGSFTGVRIALACAKGIASRVRGGPCGRLVAGRGGLGRVEGERARVIARRGRRHAPRGVSRGIPPERRGGGARDRRPRDQGGCLRRRARRDKCLRSPDRGAMPCASTWSFSKARASFCPRRCGRRRARAS